MKRGLSKRDKLAWLKALSGLSVNLSAAWFTLAIVTPNFSSLANIEALLVLTRDLVFGIVFLVLTVIFERLIK